MKKILIPIDGSKHAKLAMEKGKMIAERFGSQITLLHVNDFTHRMFNYNREVEDHFKAQFTQIGKEILEEGQAMFSTSSLQVETVYLEGNVASKIIDYANDHDFDLVIIGAKGKSGISSLFIGSSAHKVALHLHQSVLIVR